MKEMITMGLFWTNTIWFIILGSTTVFEMAAVLIKAKNRKPVIAFYLTISGVAFVFECTIFIYLKAYEYYPMIIRWSPFNDGLAGNLFSQFSVAATALLAVIFNLKYYWYFILAGVYSAIEELFLALGIYKHNWYRTWMTFIAFIIFFILVKRMYLIVISGLRNVSRYIYILFGLFPLFIITMDWVFELCRIATFNINIFYDKAISRTTLALVNFTLLSGSIMAAYIYNLNRKWKVIIMLSIYTFQYIGYKLNLIIVRKDWILIYSTVLIFGTYFYVYILDKLYRSQSVQ